MEEWSEDEYLVARRMKRWQRKRLVMVSWGSSVNDGLESVVLVGGVVDSSD